jgi:hypothetical protein
MMKNRVLPLLVFIAAASLAWPQTVPAKAAIPFGFDLDLSYEYRWAPSGGLLIEDTPVKSGADLERDYFDRAPFGRMSLGYGGKEGFSLALETTFRNQWAGDYDKADNLPIIGESGDPFQVENFFLTRGVLYWRSPRFDFALGRDSVDYGGFLYGSLLPSTRLPYLDNARARVKFGKFTLDWMVATIQAVESWDSYDVDPNASASSTNAVAYGFESSATPTTIVEGLNRFSWKLGALVLAVTDHAMMARRNNQFYFTDLFPVSSRHQTAISGTNNSMVFDAAWRPLPGLDVEAQAGLDDINANLIGISDTGTPTIDAYVAGARYRGLSGIGSFSVQAEAGYTHYLWGNYSGVGIDANNYVNPFLRFQYRYLCDAGAILLPLTSPYGPGAVWCKAGGSLALGSSGFTLGAELLYLAKNPLANLITTEVYDNTTTGAADYIHYLELSLPAKYQYRSLLLGLSPALLWREGDCSFELTALAGYHLRTGERDPDATRAWASPQADLENR